MVQISGGEPTVHPQFFEILDYATKNKNANIYLETNSFLLDNDKAKKLINLQNERENLFVIIHYPY